MGVCDGLVPKFNSHKPILCQRLSQDITGLKPAEFGCTAKQFLPANKCRIQKQLLQSELDSVLSLENAQMLWGPPEPTIETAMHGPDHVAAFKRGNPNSTKARSRQNAAVEKAPRRLGLVCRFVKFRGDSSTFVLATEGRQSG